jgi:uncharacterized membrane protein
MSDTNPPGDPQVPDPSGEPTPPPPPPAAAVPPPPPPPAVPPPPPGAAPPPPPNSGAAGVQVGDAFSWALAKFQQHIGIWIGLAAVVFALRIIQEIINRVLVNTVDEECLRGENITACSTGLFANIGLQLVFAVIFGVLVWLASIGVYRAAIKRSQGAAPEFGMLTSGENLGAYIIVAIVYGIATFVGLILCFLPGLIVIFLFQFAPFYALDKGQGVGEAFGNSYRAVTQNFVPVLLAALVNIVAAILGGLLFGIFTLVTLPFAALFTVHIYRQLNREAIAA